MEKQAIHHWFPGGNTCRGFVGFFEELRGKARRAVILKGGPGVGKSTLMREAGLHFEQQGCAVDYYHCSGDPDSLDGMFAPEKGYLILDGTAPHIVDPACPGARDGILNLGACLDEVQLASQTEEIEKLQLDIAACYARAYRYLAAANNVREDAAAVYRAALPEQEERALAAAWQAVIPSEPRGDGDHVFVQAITWKGQVQEVDSIVPARVYCLDVPWGFDADLLLRPVFQRAARNGTRRCACHDPLDAGKLAHVQVGDALFTTAVMMDAPVVAPQFDAGILRREGQRLAFDRAVFDLMINQAVESLADAKQRHDALERYYMDAMDYARLDEIKADFLRLLP